MAELATGTASRSTSSTSCSRVPTAPPSTRSTPAPTACRTRGLVVHPDIMGVRPLFDDLCRRLATHGFAVCCPEPFARARRTRCAAGDAAARIGYLRRARRRAAARRPRSRGRLPRGARRRARGRGARLLHGRHAGAEGRGHRPLRPGRRVLRDDPPARDWLGPGHARRPLDDRRRGVPDARDLRGRDDPFTPAADIDALRAAWADRPDCEIVVYPEAEHGFVHDPERPAHRADDAADAWRRVLAFLLPD